MNPLVGNLGVAASGQLKFHRIYLFGVDNGTKRDDFATHPDESGTYRKQRYINQLQLKDDADLSREEKAAKKNLEAMNDLTYVGEGNFGGTVHTSYLYKLSALYMRVIINLYHNDKEADIKYFNCSDGLKIEGATPLHSDELWKEWEKLPDVDFQGLIDFIDTKKTFDLNLTEEEAVKLCKYDTFDYVVDTIKKALTKEERPKNRLEFVLLMQSVCEMFTILRRSPDSFIADMLDGSIYNYFIMVVRVLYLTADEKLALERAEKHIVTICDFLDDAKKLYRHVPYYYAEDHQKFLHGKVGFDHPDSKAPDLITRPELVTQEERDNYPIRKFVKRYE